MNYRNTDDGRIFRKIIINQIVDETFETRKNDDKETDYKNGKETSFLYTFRI